MQTESIIQQELHEVLGGSATRGPFAAYWRASASDLALEIRGVGPLRLPVPSATVRTLRSVARPARFGRGEDTVFDRSVRDTWVIAKSRVKLDGRRWRKTLVPALERAHRELGLPAGTRLKAHLHDMLVYERGQFFLPHRDAEKVEGMVATMVVLVPSAFEGGASIIRHDGEEVTVDGGSKKELTFIAFYADCEHEVRPIERGNRVALTYALTLEGAPEHAAPDEATSEEVRGLLEEHFATPVPVDWRGREACPDRLVYLLDHEYTPQSLSWRHLKGADASRAALLRDVSAASGFEVRLASAEVFEKWSCEPEYDGYSRGWRGPEYARPVEPDEHPPLIELHDASTSLDEWVDVDGRPVDGPPTAVEPGELCYSRPSDELVPYAVEHEGYMGNWGDTVDRWYRRAAVVLWPRANEFTVLAKRDPLYALRGAAEALGDRAELRERVTRILPYWSASPSLEGRAAVVLRVASALDDPELAAGWVAPLSLDTVAIPSALVAMLERYGAEWLEARFADWGTRRAGWGPSDRTTWQLALPSIAAELPEDREVGAWFRSRLEAEHAHLASQARTALDSARSPERAAEALAPHRDAHVAVWVASSRAAAADVARSIRDHLVEGCAEPGWLSFAVDVLRGATDALSPAEWKRAGAAKATRALAKKIRRALSVPAREADDWTIDAELSCRCDLCRELGAFLADRETRFLAWPLAKARRQHVHQQCDAHDLPVTHTTRREGRPYTLLLRKTDALFDRERARREQLESDLAWLSAPAAPGAQSARPRSGQRKKKERPNRG
ncbi:MAG TPA: 2OG-Fe(II) oxygenase [Myxococcales bacterium]|nr:2OG-Fe(II) oxygenase [Myxococcales bacterium]